MLQGRYHVTTEDIRAIAHPVLRRLSTRLVWAVLDGRGQPVAFGRPTPRGRWDLGIGRGPELPAGSAAVFLPRLEQLPSEVAAPWQAQAFGLALALVGLARSQVLLEPGFSPFKTLQSQVS